MGADGKVSVLKEKTVLQTNEVPAPTHLVHQVTARTIDTDTTVGVNCSPTQEAVLVALRSTVNVKP